MELPCPIPDCCVVRQSTSAARKQHCQEHHGYPTCATCYQTMKNINMFEQHLQQPHAKQVCQLCLEQVVVGAEKHHAKDAHGFPKCPFCVRTFTSFVAFASHTLQHIPVKCNVPGCEVTFYKGATQEQEHYRAVHNFPTCATCGKDIDLVANFARHVQQCSTKAACLVDGCAATFSSKNDEQEHYRAVHNFPRCQTCFKKCDNYANFSTHLGQCVTHPCFYPGCTGVWTVEHLLFEHDDLICSLCDKTKQSADKLAKHLQTCGPKNLEKLRCDKCGAACGTSVLLQRHICLPPMPPRLDPEEYFKLTERHCTQLEVVNKRDKSKQYQVTARIRKSTVGYIRDSVRELSKRQLTTLKLDQDPTALEVMEPGTLPLPMFFMPTHFHFELRARMLYELDAAQPAWAFWLMLVYRVWNYCTDPTGGDLEWYRKFLKTVSLPPGVPAECNKLLVVRARVKDMWNKARHHKHVKVFVSTVNGKKQVLRRQLRHIDDVYRASKRARGVRDDNYVEDSSDEDTRALSSLQSVLHCEEVELDDPDGARESTRVRCSLQSNDVPLAVTQHASVPENARVASAREVEWQRLLHHFFHNVLKPVVHSKRFFKLQSWIDVKRIFFDQDLFMVEDGPECRLVDCMDGFMAKLVKQDEEDMALESLHPHVRFQEEYDSEQ